MSSKCFVCQTTNQVSYSSSNNATISGKSIMTIVTDVLDILIDLSSQKVCQQCFDIIDEIDAFEHNLTLAKSRLQSKYQKLIFKPWENHPVFIDRLLKRSSGVESNKTEMQKELEADLWSINHETPEKIDCQQVSEAWSIALLRSEMSEMTLEISGELTCFHCDQNFESVEERIFHVPNANVTCPECNDAKFPDETTAWQHVCQSHLEQQRPTSCNKLVEGRSPILMQNSFQCQKCKLSFDKEVFYWMHFVQRHPNYSKMSLCPQCQFPLPENSALAFRRHFLIEHCQYAYHCPHCQLELDSAESMLKHLESHQETPEELSLSKKSYISKSLARSLRLNEPLSKLEHFKSNMDIGLYPSPDADPSTFNQVPEDVRDECIKTIDLLRTMPYQISSSEAQQHWDLVMLKCQVSNLSFGIPGESHCFECQTHFNSVQDRIQHSLSSVHVAENTYKCSLCKNQIFHDNLQLVKHVKKRHANDCMEITDKICIDFHVQDSGRLGCQLCPGSFQSEMAFYAHHLESHKLASNCLQCIVCGKMSANIMDFKRHVLMIHGGFTHVCIVCGKRYGSRDSISAHFRGHFKATKKGQDNGSKKSQPQKCDECGWMSKSRLLHDRHLLATHGIQVAQRCQVCQETLADPKALVEHRRAVHSNDICYICAKSYLTLSDLNLHISRMHPEMANLGVSKAALSESQFELSLKKKDKTMCEICSKMVLTHNIKLHMKNHQEKSLQCPKCPRTFRWNSSLTSHLNSAHGDTVKTVTIACEFCGKQFKDKSNLRQHRYSHTGGPYSCKNCGRGFGRKDLLKSHAAKCQQPPAAEALLFQ